VRGVLHINDRFEVIEEIETVADLEQHCTDELLPLRNTLYNESTTDLIEDFVEENPPDLSEADLEQIAAWTDSVAGEFVVVRYREDDEIALVASLMAFWTGFEWSCSLVSSRSR